MASSDTCWVYECVLAARAAVTRVISHVHHVAGAGGEGQLLRHWLYLESAPSVHGALLMPPSSPRPHSKEPGILNAGQNGFLLMRRREVEIHEWGG